MNARNPHPTPAPKASVPLVLAIGFGLVVICALVAQLARKPLQELPLEVGEERLAECFTLRGQPPFALEIGSVSRLARGELVVTLSDPARPPDELPPPPPRGHGKGPWGGGDWGGGDWGKERTDWASVEEGPADTPPVEVAYIWYPPKLAESVLEKQFSAVRFRDLKHLPKHGGDVPMDSGHLSWGRYDAGYVRHRHFRLVDEEPTFHDSLRINLTLGRQACVLYMRWPQGTPGHVAAAEELLAAYAPPPSDES